MQQFALRIVKEIKEQESSTLIIGDITMRGKIVFALLGACVLFLTACVGEMTPTNSTRGESGTPTVISSVSPSSTRVEVMVDRANIRAEATVKSEKIATLTKGTLLDKFGAEGDWIRVSLPDGRKGWIYKPLIREIVSSE